MSYTIRRKRKHIARILALCIAVVLCVPSFSLQSRAATTEDGYTYEILDDGTVEITGYEGEATELDIPGEIDGKVVTGISNYALGGCSILTSITIPSSVTSIGDEAFSGCSSLTSITIPSSVTSIGDEAFSGCSSLTSITIPSNVTSIGYDAFSGCSSLTSITIPSSVTSIGDYAFSGCSSLTSITIPNSVTSIGYDAFSGCSSLTSITIPSNVTSIDVGTFSGCSSLTSITIPSNVTSIGYDAFYGCSSLTSITIPNSVTSIDFNAFWGCSNLTSITIPSSVTSIGHGVFSFCTKLTEIIVDDGNKYYYSKNNCIITNQEKKLVVACKNSVIPNDVTSIGDYAFVDCSSLKSVTIPSSVTSIGDYAFLNCSSLASITIPSSVTSIGDYAFSGCSSLASITIPSSVTSIGDYAFAWCESLTSITIPSSITSIGGCAFVDCSSLTSITIPRSITSIRSCAFSGCSSLASITIPSSVTSIGDWAFFNCSSLTSITIPSSVTSIGDYAFSGCNSLTSITIPSSVTSISDWTFDRCSSLINITIPSSVTSIGKGAFEKCDNLTTIYAYPDSYAATWASEQGYTVLTPSEPETPTEPGDEPDTSDFKFDSITYSYGSKKVNILTTAHTVEKSHKPFTIKCTAAAGSSKVTYYIDTASSTLRSETGVFENVDPAQFAETDRLCVVAKDESGKAYKVKTNLRIKKDNILKNTTLKLGKDTSFSLKENVPILGGSTMNFLIPEVPISAVVEDGKIRVGINFVEEELYSFTSDKNASNDKKKKTFKQKWADIRKDIKTTGKINKDYIGYLKKSKLQGALPGVTKKVDFTIAGYAEGNWSSDSQLEEASGEIIISLSGSSTGRKQLLVWVVPITFKVTASASGTLTGKISYDFINSQLKGDLSLLVSVLLEPYAGIGVSDWLSAGAYGKGIAKVYATLLSSVKSSGLDKFTLQGQIGLKGYFAKKEVLNLVLLNTKECTIWERKETNNSTASLSESNIEETNLLSALDNNIQEEDTDWLASKDSDTEVASIFEASSTNESKTLVSDIYGASTPQLATLGDIQVYGYVDETGTRGTYDQTVAKYVVYDKSTATSTDELIINDDGTSDYKLKFISDGEELYSVYLDSDTIFEDKEPELKDYAKSFKVTVARFNKNTKSFEKLGSYCYEDNYCYNPSLCITKDGFILSWCENKDNELLTLTQTNQIYRVTCDNTGKITGDIKQIAEDVQAVTSLAVDVDGNVLCFVDKDNMLSTEEQLIKYYMSSTGETIDISTYPTEEANVSNLSYQKLPGTDNMAMLCVLDGILAYFNPSGNEIKYCDETAYIGNSNNYYVLNNEIYYTATDYSTDTSNICKLVYNGEQFISSNLKDENGKIDFFSTDGNSFLYSVGIANINEQDDESFELNYSLKYIASVERNEIEIQDVYYDYTDFTNGDTASISVSLCNSGINNIDGFKVIVEDEASNTVYEQQIDQALVAGESTDFEIELSDLQDFNFNSIKISVQGLVFNNGVYQVATDASSQYVDLNKTELTLEGDVRVDDNANSYVHLDIINTSLKDTDAVVTLKDKNGVAFTTDIHVAANSTECVDVDNLDIGDEEKVYTATVETADEEFYTDDNETQIIVFKVQAPSYEEVDADKYNKIDEEINAEDPGEQPTEPDDPSDKPTEPDNPGEQPTNPTSELQDVHFGSWSNTEKTYDGKAIASTVSSDGDAPAIITYYKDANATKALASAPTNAGTYYAQATVAKTSKYKSGESSVVPITIKKANTTLKLITVYGYSGKAVKMKAITNSKAPVSYTFYADKQGKKKIATPKKKGTYYVKAVAKETTNYNAASSKLTKIKIVKPIAQKITARNITKALNANKLKKKAASFKLGAKAKTEVSFKKLSGKKQIIVNKNGKVTVKKGTKKGIYKLKVKITAVKSVKYKAATKTITVKVVVK